MLARVGVRNVVPVVVLVVPDAALAQVLDVADGRAGLDVRQGGRRRHLHQIRRGVDGVGGVGVVGDVMGGEGEIGRGGVPRHRTRVQFGHHCKAHF
jgi:hypothetical protein